MESIRPILTKLDGFRLVIRDSDLFKDTIDVINYDISHIRCLALGSPVSSKASLYQFAYLLELCHHFEVNTSLYDPIFNKNDELLFREFGSMVKVDIEFEYDALTLYFLPHADLAVTNDLIVNYNPSYILANNLVSHTDRLSKQKLHDKYRMLSLLVNLMGLEPESNDEFTPVRSKRKNKNKFVPPVINYDYLTCYFNSIELNVLKNNKGVWANAFTDLAFHRIT